MSEIGNISAGSSSMPEQAHMTEYSDISMILTLHSLAIACSNLLMTQAAKELICH